MLYARTRSLVSRLRCAISGTLAMVLVASSLTSDINAQDDLSLGKVLYANARPPSEMPQTVRAKPRKNLRRSRNLGAQQLVDSYVAEDLGSEVVVSPADTVLTAGTLTADEVRLLIARAVAAAQSLNLAATIAVVDREGNPLGVFEMPGARLTTQLNGARGLTRPPNSIGLVDRGLDGTIVPSSFAAISKAGTAAFFSTTGNAFTTRTAGFIIQEHFPANFDFRPAGPLYGVQFSSLPCTDVKRPALPLGIAADAGGLPIYKNGVAVGGIGIEGDGLYSIDRDVIDVEQAVEEVIAASAVSLYEPPANIRGDNILVDGIRLPYTNVAAPLSVAPQPFATLPGRINPLFPIRAAQVSDFMPAVLGGVTGQTSRRFNIIASPSTAANRLTATDVETILAQAAQQASRTRAAIRQPLGSSARVSIAVTDAEGRVLGIFRTGDAPVFGFDVSVQKARAAAFFSNPTASVQLASAGLQTYLDRLRADGINMNGHIAFSNRAIGFLHRPFFPDGLNPNPAGALSTEYHEWSVFNVGFQLDLIKINLERAIAGRDIRCTNINALAGGLQIFAGSLPLYKNNELVGAIGISGDGIDQDDIIAAAGARGFVAPVSIRADQFFVRTSRLPFVKFPRNPNL